MELVTGHLKRERESLITSAQDWRNGINSIKTNIDGARNNPKCRMCKANE